MADAIPAVRQLTEWRSHELRTGDRYQLVFLPAQPAAASPAALGRAIDRLHGLDVLAVRQLGQVITVDVQVISGAAEADRIERAGLPAPPRTLGGRLGGDVLTVDGQRYTVMGVHELERAGFFSQWGRGLLDSAQELVTELGRAPALAAENVAQRAQQAEGVINAAANLTKWLVVAVIVALVLYGLAQLRAVFPRTQ